MTSFFTRKIWTAVSFFNIGLTGFDWDYNHILETSSMGVTWLFYGLREIFYFAHQATESLRNLDLLKCFYVASLVNAYFCPVWKWLVHKLKPCIHLITFSKSNSTLLSIFWCSKNHRALKTVYTITLCMSFLTS